jgi:hypothetical protein
MTDAARDWNADRKGNPRPIELTRAPRAPDLTAASVGQDEERECKEIAFRHDLVPLGGTADSSGC